MEQAELEKYTKSIEDALSEEQKAVIQDKLGELMTANKVAFDEKKALEEKVEELTSTNKKLIDSNSSLYQQIGKSLAGSTTDDKKSEPEEDKPFDFNTIFDGKGNFRRE